MRYWLSIGDGKTYGPYDISQMQAYVAEGRINSTSQLCAEGSTTWVAASSVLPNLVNATPIPQLPLTALTKNAFVQVSLVGPILTTMCCCLIGGIVSIVYAANANTKGARGDLDGASRDAKSSKTWMTVSIVIGVIVALLYVVAAISNNSRRY